MTTLASALWLENRERSSASQRRPLRQAFGGGSLGDVAEAIVVFPKFFESRSCLRCPFLQGSPLGSHILRSGSQAPAAARDPYSRARIDILRAFLGLAHAY